VATLNDLTAAIAKTEFESTLARLKTALEPFGLDPTVAAQTAKVMIAELNLRPAREGAAPELVGIAGWHVSGQVTINVYETERIWLRWPISMTFRSPSSAQIYARLGAVIMKRLRRRSTAVRTAPLGGGHREMLCIHTTHEYPITWHSLQSSHSTGGSLWRCQECGHDTAIPLSAPLVAGGLSLSK
jgi:hypothetical protein